MAYCFGGIKVWSRRILLNFCWVSIFFYVLIANISWNVAQTPINHIIFWTSVMKTFRCIYENCFNRLRFLLRSVQNCKKLHFSGLFKEHKWGRKRETWQMIPIFPSTFSALTVYNIRFCIWKYLKFMSHFWSILWNTSILGRTYQFG